MLKEKAIFQKAVYKNGKRKILPLELLRWNRKMRGAYNGALT
jgi:hypothetical protein